MQRNYIIPLITTITFLLMVLCSGSSYAYIVNSHSDIGSQYMNKLQGRMSGLSEKIGPINRIVYIPKNKKFKFFIDKINKDLILKHNCGNKEYDVLNSSGYVFIYIDKTEKDGYVYNLKNCQPKNVLQN